MKRYFLIYSICLITFFACEDEGNTAGETTAGETTAGEITAGETTAGETTAGETTAGETTAGETTAGETTAGEITAGETTAGETTAGEITAGETTAGETTAGETTAGETTAGETTAGETTGTRTYPGVTRDQIILSNAPIPCNQVSAIAPYLPDEAGHYAASLLTPPSYPFELTTIEYTLEEPPDIPSCTSDLAHRIEVAVLTEDQLPPAELSEAAREHLIFEVPAAMMNTERRVILQSLEIPLVVNEGERLLITLSLLAEGEDHLCIAVCEDEPAGEGLELWSNAASSPFDWTPLLEFGIRSEFLIRAIGKLNQ